MVMPLAIEVGPSRVYGLPAFVQVADCVITPWKLPAALTLLTMVKLDKKTRIMMQTDALLTEWGFMVVG